MEVRIAGVDDGFFQVVKPVRTVAANDVPVAGNAVGWAQYAPVHGNEPLDHFENAPWAVGRAQGSVEKRLVGVVEEAIIIRSTVPSSQQIGPVARGTDHGKDLSRRRFDGNDGSPLVCHDAFPVRLQVQIQGDLNIVAGHGKRVEHAGLGRFPVVVADVNDVVPRSAFSAQRGFPLQF